MKDASSRRHPRPGLALWAIAIAGLMAFAPPARAADIPDLETILEKHQELSRKIVTGRIEMTITRSQDASQLDYEKEKMRKARQEALERAIHRKASGSAKEKTIEIARRTLEDVDATVMTIYLGSIGFRKATFLFDTENGSYYSIEEDPRDKEELIREYSLGEVGAMNLNKRVCCSILGDYEMTYLSDANSAIIGTHKRRAILMECRELLEAGFLSPRFAEHPTESSVQQDTEHENLVRLTFKGKGWAGEVVLDASLDYRVVEARYFAGDHLISEEACSFKTFGDTVFPSRYVRRDFDTRGGVPNVLEFEVTSAEFNVPIAPEEFKILIPRNASLHNGDTMQPVKKQWRDSFLDLFRIADEETDAGTEAETEAAP